VRKKRYPNRQPLEVLSGGGEDGVDGVAGWVGQMVSTHPMLAFDVTVMGPHRASSVNH
jgi:hypothetical protein